MLVRFNLTLDEYAALVAEHAHDNQHYTLDEAIDDITSYEMAERISLWGIQSTWRCVQVGHFVAVELCGPRQSLRDWCPEVLLAAADAVHAEGRLLEYQTWEPSWRPSWTLKDMTPVTTGERVPTDWELFCEFQPEHGRLEYVRTRQPMAV